MLADTKVIDFATAGNKHREKREHEDKESRAEAIRNRFAKALPDKPKPVKDYFKKKKAKKKR